MDIAIATCATLEPWERDDDPLYDAFRARGATATPAVWNDPEVDWAAFDACLIRTTWDYTDHLDDFLAWASGFETRGSLINPPHIVRWNANKAYLRELEAVGVPIIPTIWLEQGSKDVDLAGICRERGWHGAFLKPVVGASSSGAMPFDPDEAGLAAATAHLNDWLPRRAMMVQPFLRRVQTEGEFSAIAVSGWITHGVQKIPKSGDFRVQDDHGASDQPWTPDEAAVAVIDRVLDAAAELVGSVTYARVDVLRDETGRYLLTELELIEPSLFFRHGPEAPGVLADAVLSEAGASRR